MADTGFKPKKQKVHSSLSPLSIVIVLRIYNTPLNFLHTHGLALNGFIIIIILGLKAGELSSSQLNNININ